MLKSKFLSLLFFLFLSISERLAKMVGATRESINKEPWELKRAGLISARGKPIGILDIDGLRECVPGAA